MSSIIPPIVPPVTPPELDGMDRLIRSDGDIAHRKTSGRRHTTLVRWMRLLLPVVALGFIAIVMSFSGQNSKIAAVPRETVLPSSVSRNELINPKFQSEDAKNNPYTITADKAVQNTEKMDDIQLEKPVADMALGNKGWVAIKAISGIYNQISGNLDLNGKVEVHHDSGYELGSEKMMIDVKSNTITSTTPVTGHGPSADISAAGLTADGTTKKIIFTGPAKLILRSAPTEPTPPTKE